jgi:hypothetical protein
MKKVLLMMWAAALMACAAAPDSREEETSAPGTEARIEFVNNYSEVVWVWLQGSGKDIQEIGKLNRNAAGDPESADSVIPPAGRREFRVRTGAYTIILKNAAGKLIGPAYEEIYFPPSGKPYPFVLNPLHKRSVEAKIVPPKEIKPDEFPLLPSFTVFFSGEVIIPLAEDYVMLLKDGGEGIPLQFVWEDLRHVTVKPATSLLPATTHRLMIQLEIRDTGGERILRGDEYTFKTSQDFDDVPDVDYRNIDYDISVPGFLRVSWRLPDGTQGNELRFKNEVLDLQGTTTYTFTGEEAKTVKYKLVPYKIMDGIRAYSKTAARGDYTNPLEDLEARNAEKEVISGLGAIAGEFWTFFRKTALITTGKLDVDRHVFYEFQKQLDTIAVKSSKFRYPDIIKNPIYKRRLEAHPEVKKTSWEDINRTYTEIQKKALGTMIKSLGSFHNTRRKNIFDTMQFYNDLKKTYGDYFDENDPALVETIGKITKVYERR